MISGKNEASPLLSIRNPLSKIRRYFSTFELTRGFFIALLSSLFIYMEYWDLSTPVLSTFFGLTALYLLLQEDKKTWFFSGFFIGFFWFWWIVVSFGHYNMLWAIPIGLLVISFSYGILFWFMAYVGSVYRPKDPMVGKPTLQALLIKATGLLLLSYLHPFGFDWFKPELMFVNSYIGIEKWQFAIILTAMVLSIWKRQFLYLFLVLFAYQPVTTSTQPLSNTIQLTTLNTPVEDKWNKDLHTKQFDEIFNSVDKAIEDNKTLIILPESVFPIFLNYDKTLIAKFKERAKHISIVVGGLYWDGKTPHNSTYIFTNGKITIANKVLLVPFGESNPLPDFLSDWVNKVFYDGAVDYKASENVIDYTIDGITYRNAICFEATSEKLYEGKPENMIVLSNNGWFTPSTEPTLQRLLLQYYSKKYGTTIYHSVNMSESYVIQSGKVIIQ
ncbi:MAG: apolipoprotein N-acyltransferase [Sulfurovum sp.]|nr:apolipoprotein N-acyltransferase [Sulfurovum sp.]